MRLLPLLVVVGCGRIAFDPLGDGGGGSTGDGGNRDALGDGSGSTFNCVNLYAEGNSALPPPGLTAGVNMSAYNESGLLLLLAVTWDGNAGNVTNVSDASSNTYTQVGAVARITAMSQTIYRAPIAPSAGAAVVTITFDQLVNGIEVVWMRYRGIDLSDPIMEVTSGVGNSGVAAAGPIPVPSEAVLVAVASTNQTAGGGPGYQQRVMINGMTALEGCATSPGNYNATAPFSPSGNWVMQLLALRPR